MRLLQERSRRVGVRLLKVDSRSEWVRTLAWHSRLQWAAQCYDWRFIEPDQREGADVYDQTEDGLNRSIQNVYILCKRPLVHSVPLAWFLPGI